MSHVICPETITSPAPNPAFYAAFPELKPNQPCGLKCEVRTLAEVMEFRCGRGHSFYAIPADVRS